MHQSFPNVSLCFSIHQLRPSPTPPLGNFYFAQGLLPWSHQNVWHALVGNAWNSLHDRRFMRQAGRTRYFARSATRARSAIRGEEKNKALFPSCGALREISRSPCLARKAPVIQAILEISCTCRGSLICRLLYVDRRICGRNPSDGACISHTSPWSQPFPE